MSRPGKNHQGFHDDPPEGHPARVLEDVLDEKITAEYGRHEYGVVIDATTLEVDAGATRRERTERLA